MNAFADKIVSGQDLLFNLEFQCDPESGWFIVHVVELPGCISQGATIDEAKANIAKALEGYMEVLLERAIRSQATRGSHTAQSNVNETAKMLVRPKFEVRA